MTTVTDTTRARLERARQLAAARGKHGLEDLKRLLRERYPAPAAV